MEVNNGDCDSYDRGSTNGTIADVLHAGTGPLLEILSARYLVRGCTIATFRRLDMQSAIS